MGIDSKFSDADVWKGIILYGLNTATYKLALAQCLIDFSRSQKSIVSWDELSETFLHKYISRLKSTQMPQQGDSRKLSVMERVVKQLNLGVISYEKAIIQVSSKGLENVVPRFQTIGSHRQIGDLDISKCFYEFDYGNSLSLKDSILSFSNEKLLEMEQEAVARWSLLEGAFYIQNQSFELANDIREIYLSSGYFRKNLTGNVPFLQGYQGNTCFYCGESIEGSPHVDHVLPRQVLNHDEIWNLVLAHLDCNLHKSDKVVSPHFIEKLILRNENIMGSNHPWKNKIRKALGNSPQRGAKSLNYHYDNVKQVLGENYWGGSRFYNPNSDPFYRRLITVINRPVVKQ